MIQVNRTSHLQPNLIICPKAFSNAVSLDLVILSNRRGRLVIPNQSSPSPRRSRIIASSFSWRAIFVRSSAGLSEDAILSILGRFRENRNVLISGGRYLTT